MDLRDHFMKFLQNNSRENRLLQTAEQEDNPDDGNSRFSTPTPSDIAFENDNMKLIVQKSYFKRQKNFKLQDELFLFRVRQKDTSAKLPLMLDILDFLHAALLHVLDSIKTFYEKGT